jgi:predicted nucleic acid-binding protein
MYLIDTNIFLEALLEQQKAEEVHKFFEKVDLETLFITDISLHSIGIILFKFKRFKLFLSFLNDIIINGLTVLSLNPDDLKSLDKIAKRFKLDFDDAYQYYAAQKYDLEIVSFDKDFDKTVRKRKEPGEILK